MNSQMFSQFLENESVRKLSLIVLAGIAFAAMEFVLLYGPPRKYIYAAFKTNAKLTKKQLEEATHLAVSRIVGAVHILIQVPLALYVLWDKAIIQDKINNVTESSSIMLVISGGYFLHDLIVCIVSHEGAAYVVHASVCLSAFLYSFLNDHLHYYGAAFLMWELSTPFVYMRWYLHQLGRTSSRLYVANGILMLIVFFLCRNVFGPVTSLDFFRESRKALANPRPGGVSAMAVWVISGMNITLNCLNLFWFSKMLRGAIKVLSKKPLAIGKDGRDEWHRD